MKRVKELWWIVLNIIMVAAGIAFVTFSSIQNKLEIIIVVFLGILIISLLRIQMLSLRKNDLSERFIEEVHSLKDIPKDEMEKFSNDIAKVVSESIRDSMFPVFDEINDGMKELLELFGKEYKDGISDIVDNFIIQMNKTLGKQFISWGENIDRLCKWQENTAASVEKVAHNLMDNTTKIETIFSYVENLMKQLDSYYDKINSLNTGVISTFDKMKECNGMYSEITSRQEQCVLDFNKHERSLVELFDEFKGLINNYNVAISNTTSSYEELMDSQNEKMTSIYNDFEKKFNKSIYDQIQVNAKVSKALQQLLDNSTNNLREINKKYDKNIEAAINSTFESFDSSLANLVGHISGTVADINEITLNIPKALNSSFKEMQRQLEKYIDAIEDMRKTTLKASKQINKSSMTQQERQIDKED